MILDLYKDSFEFASKKITILLILGVLSLFSILIIPLIFVYGYGYRVIKMSTQSMINGEDEPPEFGEFKKMFIDGLRYIVVYLAYLIIPFIIIAISAMNGSVNWILLIIGIILMIICMLVAYLAVPNMAANDDSISAAFAFSDIIDIMGSIGYLRFILTYIGIALISLAIVFVATLVISFIFGILGVATLSISGSGVGVVSLIGTIIFNFVMFFLVAPYISLFKDRCQGLIYTIGS
ncbi:DUF4013 domain-containing protein [Methanobrevibacter sp.]|uniref:DUF4013 domain-containing protein n=1 Tax=Methanobrevibacter sp. TaxID=66852 RepID=UPI00388E19FC